MFYKCHLLCVVKLTGLRDFSLLVPLASLACVGGGTKLGLVLGAMLGTCATDRKGLKINATCLMGTMAVDFFLELKQACLISGIAQTSVKHLKSFS